MSSYQEIPKPPTARNESVEERIAQIERYLWKLADRLEYIINQMQKGDNQNG